MQSLQNICVFCGASSKGDPLYLKYARDVADILIDKKSNLIYGGAKWGIMGEIANHVLDQGGKVKGIIPKFIQEFEGEMLESKMELIIVESMHLRKEMMVECSDAFIIMPGGYGTLDEFFEILTWKQLGLHQKPIVILNVNGYWDHLIALLDHIVGEKLAPVESKGLYTVVENTDDIFDALTSQKTFDEPVAKLKWS